MPSHAATKSNHVATRERVGALSRQETRNVERREGVVYEANSIQFASPNQILDSANGLGVFKPGHVIEVRGTANNNTRFVVDTVLAGTITVTGTVISEVPALTELRRLAP